MAKAFGVNTSLRYWKKSLSKFNPKRSLRASASLRQRHIENIQIIHHLLKEKGMTIEGAKNHMATSRDSEQAKMNLLNHLEKIKEELTSLPRDNL